MAWVKECRLPLSKCPQTLLLTCKSIQAIEMISMHVGRRGCGLDTISQDRPGGGCPREAVSACLETGDQGEGAPYPLRCLALEFRVYRTTARWAWAVQAGPKGPFRLEGGGVQPHSRATLIPPFCWKGAAGLGRKGPTGRDYSCP